VSDALGGAGPAPLGQGANMAAGSQRQGKAAKFPPKWQVDNHGVTAFPCPTSCLARLTDEDLETSIEPAASGSFKCH
jgi:hypothetical protein